MLLKALDTSSSQLFYVADLSLRDKQSVVLQDLAPVVFKPVYVHCAGAYAVSEHAVRRDLYAAAAAYDTGLCGCGCCCCALFLISLTISRVALPTAVASFAVALTTSAVLALCCILVAICCTVSTVFLSSVLI
jgi:hypothetical protein